MGQGADSAGRVAASGRGVGSRRRALACALALAASAPRAEVTLDGTLGPIVDLDAAQAGQYLIPESVGTLRGANLFHSFARFSLSQGQSASFTGPAGIGQVLARVTGGEASSIDGTLRSSLPGASLWLINPAGVVFGPNATLEVDGSFHAATAGQLRLADGALFSALDPAGSTLSAAPPEAFGFLDAQPPAGVEARGASLAVPAGRALTLAGATAGVGGGSALSAPAGRLLLVGLGGAGEVRPGAPDLLAEGVARAGAGPVPGSPPVVEPGGAIRIRAGQFVVDGASVTSLAVGQPEGGAVDVQAEQMTVRSGGRVVSVVPGPADGAGLDLRVGQLQLIGQPGDAFLFFDPTTVASLLPVFTGVASIVEQSASGRGASINVSGGSLTLAEGAALVGLTLGPGDGGDLALEASETIAIEQRAVLGALTLGAGRSGSVSVSAPAVLLRGDGTLAAGGIGSSTLLEGTAGDVEVRASRTLQLTDGASIDASTLTTGQGGSVRVSAPEILIGPRAKITAGTFGQGAGGNISVEGGLVSMQGAAQDAAELAALLREGFPQDPWLAARVLTLQTGINLSSYAVNAGGGAAGTAGSATLRGASLQMRQGSAIETRAQVSDGGNVALDFTDLVLLSEAALTTSVSLGTGVGGNIDVRTGFLVLQAGRIEANAFGGPGGNITILAANLLQDPASVIEASSAQSVDGTITIEAPQVDVSAAVAVLPENVADASTLLSRRCEGRAAGSQSSLAVQRPVAPALGFVLPVLSGAVPSSTSAVAAGAEEIADLPVPGPGCGA